MPTNVLLIVAGAALLALAGDRLVEFAAAIARRARLTPAVIGLTIVAAGTSTPELSVSIAAALRGSPEIALGNVVGSNSANIGLILGVAALIGSVAVRQRLLRFEYPFMVLSSGVLILLSRDGLLDRLEGAFFAASMVAFVAYSIWVARAEVSAAEREAIAEEVPAKAAGLARHGVALLLLGVALSLAGLWIGAELFVRGAIGVAAALGVSERVIGLTVVAVGTSLPELVTSVTAALKKHHDIAVTNVVGSNIFNVLMILGLASLVRPIAVGPEMIPDMAIMMTFAIVLFPLVIMDRELGRRDGLVLTGMYVFYILSLITRG
jgi:cation:H+ antiporter